MFPQKKKGKKYGAVPLFRSHHQSVDKGLWPSHTLSPVQLWNHPPPQHSPQAEHLNIGMSGNPVLKIAGVLLQREQVPTWFLMGDRN